MVQSHFHVVARLHICQVYLASDLHQQVPINSKFKVQFIY